MIDQQGLVSRSSAIERVHEALLVAYSTDTSLTLKLRNDSAVAVSVLKTALKQVPQGVQITLNVQQLESLPSEVIQSLLQCGASGSCLIVTPQSRDTLRRMNLINDDGGTKVPAIFRWKVTCQSVSPGVDHRELSEPYLRTIASELSHSLLRTEAPRGTPQSQQERLNLAKTAVHRYFTLEEVDELAVVTLTGSVLTQMLRDAFIDFLQQYLPKDKSFRIDLSVLGPRDASLCNSLLAFLHNRMMAKQPPVELVVPPSLARVFPDRCETGYVAKASGDDGVVVSVSPL